MHLFAFLLLLPCNTLVSNRNNGIDRTFGEVAKKTTTTTTTSHISVVIFKILQIYLKSSKFCMV